MATPASINQEPTVVSSQTTAGFSMGDCGAGITEPKTIKQPANNNLSTPLLDTTAEVSTVRDETDTTLGASHAPFTMPLGTTAATTTPASQTYGSRKPNITYASRKKFLTPKGVDASDGTPIPENFKRKYTKKPKFIEGDTVQSTPPKRKYIKRAKLTADEASTPTQETAAVVGAMDSTGAPVLSKPKRKYTRRAKLVEDGTPTRMQEQIAAQEAEEVDARERPMLLKPKRKYTRRSKATGETPVPGQKKLGRPSGNTKQVDRLGEEQTGEEKKEWPGFHNHAFKPALMEHSENTAITNKMDGSSPDALHLSPMDAAQPDSRFAAPGAVRTSNPWESILPSIEISGCTTIPGAGGIVNNWERIFHEPRLSSQGDQAAQSATPGNQAHPTPISRGIMGIDYPDRNRNLSPREKNYYQAIRAHTGGVPLMEMPDETEKPLPNYFENEFTITMESREADIAPRPDRHQEESAWASYENRMYQRQRILEGFQEWEQQGAASEQVQRWIDDPVLSSFHKPEDHWKA